MSVVSPLASGPVAEATLRERLGAGATLTITAILGLAAFLNGWKGWAGGAFTAFALPFVLLLTTTLGAGLLSDELESGHAQLVLLRPLTRAQYFGGRLLGAGLALAACLTLAFAAAAAGTVMSGGRLDGLSFLVLPAVFVQAFAWLALLAALSVVLRGWGNVGVLVIAALVWIFLSITLPSLLHSEMVGGLMQALKPYLGPQDASVFVRQASQRQRPDLAPLLYDLLWTAGAWLAGALLLNRRELARRRP